LGFDKEKKETKNRASKLTGGIGIKDQNKTAKKTR